MTGCPDDDVCQSCPCADEDDVCFPDERLRAETIFNAQGFTIEKDPDTGMERLRLKR